MITWSIYIQNYVLNIKNPLLRSLIMSLCLKYFPQFLHLLAKYCLALTFYVPYRIWMSATVLYFWFLLITVQCVCACVWARYEGVWMLFFMLFHSRTIAPAANVFCWLYPTLNLSYLILSSHLISTYLILSVIEAETKCQHISWPNFQMHFLEWEYIYICINFC